MNKKINISNVNIDAISIKNKITNVANATGKKAIEVVKSTGKSILNNAVGNINAGVVGAISGYNRAGKHASQGAKVVDATFGFIGAIMLNQAVSTADGFAKIGDKVFGGSK